MSDKRGKLALAVLLLWAAPTRADVQSFAAGTLIIPMDACYQAAPDQPKPAACTDGKSPDDGVLKAYGLVYTLLRKGQQVYVAIDPDKLAPSDEDFAVVGDPSGSPPPVQALARPGDATVSFTSQTQISYTGAPFIIDSSQAAAVRALLLTDPDLSHFPTTAIHVAQAPFSAPVALQLQAQPPKLALIDPCSGAPSCAAGGVASTENIPLMQAYLRRAGLDQSGWIGTYASPGLVADVVTLNDIVTSNALAVGSYQMVFLPHYKAPTLSGSSYALASPDLTALQRLTAFVSSGGVLLGQCAAVFSLEGGQDHNYTRYQPPAGIGSYLYTPASGGYFNQINNCYPGNAGGFQAGCAAPQPPLRAPPGQSLHFDEPANPLVQIGDFSFFDFLNLPPGRNVEDTVGNWDVNPGADDWQPSVAHLVHSLDQSQANDMVDVMSLARLPKGQVVYLGGHTYAEPGTLSTAGVRLVLNTLLFGNPQVPVVEQARSGTILSDDGHIYLGTYVEAPGTPPVYSRAADAATWVFPRVIGHLRQYPPSRFPASTKVSLGASGWDWDAAALLPQPSARTVWTQQGSGASAAFLAFTTGNRPQFQAQLGVSGNDADVLVSAVLAGRLGGIDHSTLALVPGSPVIPGGAARPTMVYAGALDGQLHAVAVSGGGITPGTELWSFLPQDQLGLLRFNTAGVDGSPNVRDLFADWTASGVRGWRTYLAVPEGAMGTSVHALDVSDPQHPALRWQQGTAAAGVVLGNASGATWGMVYTPPGLSPELVVASNQPGGQGLLVTALAATSGAPLWNFAVNYTQTLPGSTSVVPNAIPGAPAVVDLNNSGAENGVLVADYEGKIWLLDAATGRNLAGTGTPLYDVGKTPQGNVQPIGAPLAVYHDAATQSTMVLAVTGGADWASPTDNYALYQIRVNNSGGAYSGTLVSRTAVSGRGYAAPTVSGNDVYLLLSYGYLSGALSGTLQDPGTILRMNLSSHAVTTLATDTKGAGALGVDASGDVVGATVKDLLVVGNSGHDTASTSVLGLQPMTLRAWLEPM